MNQQIYVYISFLSRDRVSATRKADNEKFIEVRESARSRLSIHFVLSRRGFIPCTFSDGTYGNVGAPPCTGFRISI